MDLKKFRRELFHPKTDKIHLLASLKLEKDFKSFNKGLSVAMAHPITRRLIEGVPFPKELDQLRPKTVIPITPNLTGEIAWVLHSVKKFADQINSFLNLKSEFEHKLTIGEYEDADSCLQEIKKLGYSHWYVENLLLLEELRNGSEQNWEHLSQLCQKITNPISLISTENVSKRAESGISYTRYRGLVSNQLSDLNLNQGFFEYFCFKLNYQGYIGYEEFPHILSVESTSPVFDRYLTLVDVIIEIVINNYSKETPEYIGETIKVLLENITSDFRIKNLKQFVLKDFTDCESENVINELIEQYTLGKYEDCINKIPGIIDEYSNSVELYEIYTKSFIELDRKLEVFPSSDIIKNLVEGLYDLYSKNEKSFDATEKLLKISSILSSHKLGKQLYGLLKKEAFLKSSEDSQEILFVLNSSIFNPRVVCYLSKEADLDLFKNLPDITKETLSLFIAINKGDEKGILESTAIPAHKKQLYIGRSSVIQKKHEDAIKIYEKILDDTSISPITREEAIVHLFTSYLQVNELEKAVKLYVNNSLENKGMITRLSTEELHSKLEMESSQVGPDLIEVPIFYQIFGVSDYDLYVTYDDFLDSKSIERPSQLLQYYQSNGIEKDSKLTYFLSEVSRIEVLNYSLNFSGSEDVIQERLTVLKDLLSLDQDNETKYIKEITTINQKNKVNEVLREVNKGRITVNLEQLKHQESNAVKEGFTRFKELSEYSKDKDLFSVDSTSKLFKKYLENTELGMSSDKVVFVNDPAFITFKVMFLELRDKFLNSKEYGLDGYLSTRIRHGTLENHIRSVFEALNLLSKKSGDGNYEESLYWNNNTPSNIRHLLPEIQNKIQSFSAKVDELIEYIIKDLIQVKTEKQDSKSYGLFNYSFSKEQLATIFHVTRDSINDYQSFMEMSFEVLEESTKILLKEIRRVFKSEVKSQFENLINEFGQEIRDLLSMNGFPELTSSIAQCQTNLQNEIDSISEWFNLSNPSREDMDVETLIQSSIEITNSIYPAFHISPVVKTSFKYPILGSVHFIYLNRILLDNIIKHSKLKPENLEIEISARLEENTLILSFTNNLSNEIDKKQLEGEFNQIKQTWDSNKNTFERTNIEGGSGFDKIRRILAFDIKANKYDFKYSLVENQLTVVIEMDVNIQTYEY